MDNRRNSEAITVENTVKEMMKEGFRHKTLEERTEECGGLLVLDTEYDWGEPVGREIW